MIGQGGSDRHGAIQFNLYRTVTPVGFVQEHIAFAFDNHTGDLALARFLCSRSFHP